MRVSRPPAHDRPTAPGRTAPGAPGRREPYGRGRLVAPLVSAALVLTTVLSSCTTAEDPAPARSPGAASSHDTGSSSPSGADDAASAPGGAAGDDSDTGSTGGTSGDSDGSGTRDGSDAGDDVADEAGDTSDGGTASQGSGGQTGGDGSEVVPAGPGTAPEGGLGEAPVPAAGHLDPDQRTGTADGLVAGFPDDVVLVPAGASVTSSSVTGTGDRYQVTLAATVDGACDPVLLDYRSWFTTGGFAEQDASTGPDGSTVDLARGDGTVRVDASRTSAGCTVTVLAALSAR